MSGIRNVKETLAALAEDTRNVSEKLIDVFEASSRTLPVDVAVARFLDLHRVLEEQRLAICRALNLHNHAGVREDDAGVEEHDAVEGEGYVCSSCLFAESPFAVPCLRASMLLMVDAKTQQTVLQDWKGKLHCHPRQGNVFRGKPQHYGKGLGKHCGKGGVDGK